MNEGAYMVYHPEIMDIVCYHCDLNATTPAASMGQAPAAPTAGVYQLKPTDAYHSRVFIEPLGLELRAWAGEITALTVDFGTKRVTVTFAPVAANVLQNYRLEVAPTGQGSRSATDFKIAQPAGAKLERGAYSLPTGGGGLSAVISYTA
jgi:hypothetical protein